MVGNDNKVAIRQVSLLQQDETQAVIDKGLDIGERVVTTGFARLTANAEVTVTNAEEAPPAGAAPAVPQSEMRRGRGNRREQRSEATPPNPAAITRPQ